MTRIPWSSAEIPKEGSLLRFPPLQASHGKQTENTGREEAGLISPEETLGWLVHFKEA
jgi:hypothetical protein